MQERTADEVRAELHALGLASVGNGDLVEVARRINAIEEGVSKLRHFDEDSVEPLPIFWLTEEGGRYV